MCGPFQPQLRKLEDIEARRQKSPGLASRPAGSIVVAEQSKESWREARASDSRDIATGKSGKREGSRLAYSSAIVAGSDLGEDLGPILGERTAPDHATRPCVFPTVPKYDVEAARGAVVANDRRSCSGCAEEPHVLVTVGGEAAARSGRDRSGRPWQAGDGLDLDSCAARQRRDLHGRARRLVGTEALGVDRVQLREVAGAQASSTASRIAVG
jgi:hypothetical protein